MNLNLPHLYSTSDLRDADDYTIRNGVSSIDLMERASEAFVTALLNILSPKKVIVFAGMGNNGGDAAAIARLLKQKGILAELYLVHFKDQPSEDCAANLSRLANYHALDEHSNYPKLNPFDLIVDGIFGSGFKNSMPLWIAELIRELNNSNIPIASIDIPSGVPGDGIAQNDAAVMASWTFTFQEPKPAFFLPENGPFIGNLSVIDIGLNKAFFQTRASNTYFLTNAVRSLLPQRVRWSHKGTYGHASIFAGSLGKIGAAVIASKAALFSGCGLVTATIPKCGLDILQTALPEAMCITQGQTLLQSEKEMDFSSFSSIGIGPGIGTARETRELLRTILSTFDKPIVLDADAINIIALEESLRFKLPMHAILTPHIKEFDRLVGGSKNSLDRNSKAIDFAQKHKVFVILKDAFTRIFTPKGHTYINTIGNSGMATAGSGDALAGVIVGLLAQGLTPLAAAITGVYFHAKAGDEAKKKYGTRAVTASRILNHLRIE